MDSQDRIGQLPEDWTAEKGKQHLVLESGMRPSQHVTDNVNDIPSLGGENVHEDGSLVFENVRYLSRDYYEKMPKGKIQDGDILINKDGANTGKLAFAKVKPFMECAVNEHLFIVRNKGAFNQEFLFYFLFSEKGKNQIQRKIVGSAQGGINNSFPKGIFLPRPPKPEQTAIATILSKVDEAIEATQKSIKAAEKLKKSLMQNMLTGKLKPDGTWRTEDEFWEDEKFGKMPDGWLLGKLKKVIKLKNGKGNTTSNLKIKPNTEYNIPVFGGNGITGYYHTPLLTEPTLIIGRVGEYCGNVFLTPTKSWVTDNAMLVDKFLIEDYSLEFFKYKFNTLNFIHYSDTTGQPKLTQGSIGSISFIYPESEIEQTKIADKINSVDIRLVDKQSKIKTLQRLKKSLMQNLLTGKVRLPEEFIKQFENAAETKEEKVV